VSPDFADVSRNNDGRETKVNRRTRLGVGIASLLLGAAVALICYLFVAAPSGNGTAHVTGTPTPTGEEPATVTPDPEAFDLVKQLKSSKYAQVYERLIRKGRAAIPALEEGLSAPDFNTREGCAISLTYVGLAGSAGRQEVIPILIDALEKAPVDTRDNAPIIGGLGRLKAQEAVPILEKMYNREVDPEKPFAKGISWALKQITGKDYGPTEDFWRGSICVLR